MFSTHSGLHPVYGSPVYSGKQTHDPAPLRSLHTALAPQGEGLHGFLGASTGGGGAKNSKVKLYWSQICIIMLFVS